MRRLIFVDTNILLDFYRVESNATLQLLDELEAKQAELIFTYKVQVEFKKNRQTVISSALKSMKIPDIPIASPAFLRDARSLEVIAAERKDIKERVQGLQQRIIRAISDPAMHDPVFQSFQRLHKVPNSLFLAEGATDRRTIERLALRRFLAGYPPRKKEDTSIGDAINWEWMIACCKRECASLVLVSHDSDFGCTINGKSFVNDWLKSEFHSRLSKRHSIQLVDTLADGLKLLGVKASPEAKADEKAAAAQRASEVDSVSEALKRIIGDPIGSSREMIENMVRGKEA